jgi:lipoyl(octanoyl) transferase
MRIEDWGLIDYESSVARQLSLVEQVSSGGEGCIVVCTHPPLVSLGRAADVEADLEGWQGAVFSSSRGGRATYHGPSQIVIYPVISLKEQHARFAARDVHAYLRALEDFTVEVLRETGLQEAGAHTAQDGQLSLTGVWVGGRKIASIGVAVRKWVTYHGVAINILRDPNAFKGIRPCGFTSETMTSLEEELGQAQNITELRAHFGQRFQNLFSNQA